MRPVPWVALLALTAAALAFTLIAPLEIISSFASATFLLIFFAINLSAWRLRRRIGLAGIWPLAGAAATAASFLLLMARSYAEAPLSLFCIVGFYAAAVGRRDRADAAARPATLQARVGSGSRASA